MKETIKIALRTREVYQLFERKINGDRLFIPAILHKFNHVIRQHKQQNSNAIHVLNHMNQMMIALKQQFEHDTKRLEELLSKQSQPHWNPPHSPTEFHPKINVSNALDMRLIDFITTYDKLIATSKTLYLTGCFISDMDYYSHIKRMQTATNRMLSKLILIPL